MNQTINQLNKLISTFLLGFAILIISHIVFMNLIEQIDKKTENIEKSLQIGYFIEEDLYKIRSDFYELVATTTNLKGQKLIVKEINEKINLIKKSLDVFSNGGKIKRSIKLNIPGHTVQIKEINYKKPLKNNIPLEQIDIAPKLKQIESMVKEIQKKLKEHKNTEKVSLKQYLNKTKELKRFYKTTPAFFTRIIENNRRLIYESEKELKKIKKDIIERKEIYKTFEIITVVLTIMFVILFGTIISRQVKNTNINLEKQKNSTRGLLDSQENIVVVSNGEEMIDRNK